MSKLIHTAINLPGAPKPQTRTSESRQYQACLVRETTERAAEINREHHQETKRKLEAQQSLVNEMLTKMTLQSALEEHERLKEAWFSVKASDIGNAALHAACDAGRWGSRHEECDRAKVNAGFVNTYKTQGYMLIEAHRELEGLKHSVERFVELKVGMQIVISWHGSKDLAHKAVGKREVDGWLKVGYKIKVHTNIHVRDVQQKAEWVLS